MSLSFAIKSLFLRNGIQTNVFLCNKRFSSAQTYKNIIAEVKGQHKNIGFIQLHRPKVNIHILKFLIKNKFYMRFDKGFKCSKC